MSDKILQYEKAIDKLLEDTSDKAIGPQRHTVYLGGNLFSITAEEEKKLKNYLTFLRKKKEKEIKS